ncbi:MAG: extracellular solute-binding protein [Azoarcus sp.]|nr:extracellular solute-binding protein [Azoarcus sp.]
MGTTFRNISRRSLVCAIGAVMFSLSAMSMAAPAKKAKSAPAAKAEKPVQVTQIELFHKLPPTRAKALQSLVERFNAQSPVPVVLVENDWRAPQTPHLLILDGADQEAFLLGKPRYKPLFALMKEAGVALKTVKPAAMVTRKPVSGNGQLLALPVGLNTPVLFFNRAALKRGGVEASSLSTWADVTNAANKLSSTSRCVVSLSEPARVLIENVSAWSNLPAAKGKQVVFNDITRVRYLSQVASLYRADLLKIFESTTEGEERFAKGECALYIGPSDSWAYFQQKSGLDVGVTRLPYIADIPGAPQNTLADGASLWVSAGKKSPEYKVVAKFVDFWLTPDNQVGWQRETGYLPLNRAGIFATDSQLLGNELEGNKVAIGQLINKPVSGSSAVQPVLERDSARSIIESELAGVWADRKSTKDALDTAAKRLSSGK